MTIDQPAFDPMEEQTSATQFVPEPPQMSDELPTAEAEYPIYLKIEFDPAEFGGAEDFDDANVSDAKVEQNFAFQQTEDITAVPMGLLETPEGYAAPQFEDSHATDDANNFDSTAETSHDLDSLFAELAETASGQSAEIAVWCPWLIDASQN